MLNFRPTPRHDPGPKLLEMGLVFLPKSSYTRFLLAPILPWIKSITHVSASGHALNVLFVHLKNHLATNTNEWKKKFPLNFGYRIP